MLPDEQFKQHFGISRDTFNNLVAYVRDLMTLFPPLSLWEPDYGASHAVYCSYSQILSCRHCRRRNVSRTRCLWKLSMRGVLQWVWMAQGSHRQAKTLVAMRHALGAQSQSTPQRQNSKHAVPLNTKPRHAHLSNPHRRKHHSDTCPVLNFHPMAVSGAPLCTAHKHHANALSLDTGTTAPSTPHPAQSQVTILKARLCTFPW